MGITTFYFFLLELKNSIYFHRRLENKRFLKKTEATTRDWHFYSTINNIQKEEIKLHDTISVSFNTLTHLLTTQDSLSAVKAVTLTAKDRSLTHNIPKCLLKLGKRELQPCLLFWILYSEHQHVKQVILFP